ncbi:hypothetical protein LVY75_00135 (plasmid) [Sinorhizobium sp. B11]
MCIYTIADRSMKGSSHLTDPTGENLERHLAPIQEEYYRNAMTKKSSRRFVSENTFIAGGVALILIGVELWLRSTAEIWSLEVLSFVCLKAIGACLIAAGLLDKRKAARKAEWPYPARVPSGDGDVEARQRRQRDKA